MDEARGAAPFRGFVITRLEVTGTLETVEGVQPVTGTAWLERLWGDVPLPLGPIVWDRLTLQLDDGTDVSILRRRRRSGGRSPRATGFLAGPGGEVEGLERGAVRMEPVGDLWVDPRGGAGFPVRWRVEAGELDLDVEPVDAAALRAFGEPLWTGAVTARGTFAGRPIAGSGFLELTGYGGRP